MHSSSNKTVSARTRAGLNIKATYHFAVLFIVLAVAAGLWLHHLTSSLNSDNTSLLETLSYLEDESSNLQASTVVKQPNAFISTSEKTLNFGLTQSAYWFWITVSRPSDNTASVMVELGYPHLDSIDVFQVLNGSAQLRYQLGDSLPFRVRPIEDRTFVIPVEFQSAEKNANVLLRVKTQGSLQLPVSVRSLADYHSHDRAEQLLLGVYYGILLGILAYNLLLAFGLKDPVYINYCAYVSCLLFFQFSLNGLAYEHLWPESVYMQQVSTPMFAALSLLFGTRFTHLFLNIDQQSAPRLFMGYRIMERVFLALVLASPFTSMTILTPMVSISIMLGVIFMFSTALGIYLQGDKNANFYLLAWGILLVGVALYSAKTLGLLPESFITEYAVQIGSAIEMIVLSYALADRFNRLRDENTRLTEQAKATLEIHVENRTRELNDTLKQLKTANSQLESISQRDPLTDIYNRRYFNQILDRTWTDIAGSTQTVSLIMIDIDHFKAINDNKGHLVGDEVIITLANVIANKLANTPAVCARFGGEEFVVLLQNATANEVTTIAEELRQQVESLEFTTPVLNNDQKPTTHHSSQQEPIGVFGISISLGIATRTADSPGFMTTLNLIEQADQALYEAKNSGRNQYCVYAPPKNLADKAA